MAETGWSGLHNGEHGKSRSALRHYPYRSPLLHEVWGGELLNANMNTTDDQAIPINKVTKYYRVGFVQIWGATTSLTTAKGSLYARPNKAGPLVMLTTSAYSTLTAPATQIETTGFISSVTVQTQFITDAEELYLSLTTPQGAEAYCNIGVVIRPMWDEIFHFDDANLLRG